MDTNDSLNKNATKKKVQKKRRGFTDKMAISLIALLFLGLLLGYDLAVKSIYAQYMGALACYTAVFCPVGTAISIVLAKVVDKNKEENTGADGMGIAFATAQANNFNFYTEDSFENSPSI